MTETSFTYNVIGKEEGSSITTTTTTQIYLIEVSHPKNGDWGDNWEDKLRAELRLTDLVLQLKQVHEARLRQACDANPERAPIHDHSHEHDHDPNDSQEAIHINTVYLGEWRQGCPDSPGPTLHDILQKIKCVKGNENDNEDDNENDNENAYDDNDDDDDDDNGSTDGNNNSYSHLNSHRYRHHPRIYFIGMVSKDDHQGDGHDNRYQSQGGGSGRRYYISEPFRLSMETEAATNIMSKATTTTRFFGGREDVLR